MDSINFLAQVTEKPTSSDFKGRFFLENCQFLFYLAQSQLFNVSLPAIPGLNQVEPKHAKSSNLQRQEPKKNPDKPAKSYLEPDYAISKVAKMLSLKSIKGPQKNENLVGSLGNSVPKVLKAPVKKPKSVVELYTQRIQARTKRRTANEESEDTKQPKDHCECAADSNLKQAEPIGTLTVILPQNSCSRSTLNASGFQSQRSFLSDKTAIRKAREYP